jgi:hypothetical protein
VICVGPSKYISERLMFAVAWGDSVYTQHTLQHVQRVTGMVRAEGFGGSYCPPRGVLCKAFIAGPRSGSSGRENFSSTGERKVSRLLFRKWKKTEGLYQNRSLFDI